MKRPGANYALLGGFVLAMTAALLGTLYVLGGRRGPSDSYYVELGNVSGIRTGAAVTYEGYPVGEVTAIDATQGERTRFLLQLQVRKGWLIPEDSLARVVADGLLSQVSIEISEGASTRYLASGGQLEGVQGANMFAAVNAVASEFESLSRTAVRPLLERLHGSVEVLADALEGTAPGVLQTLDLVSTTVGEELPGSLGQLAALSARLNEEVPRILDNLVQASARLREGTPHVPRILSNLEAASEDIRDTTPTLTASLERSAGRVDTLLSRRNVKRVDTMLANLERASTDVGSVLGQLDAAAASVNGVIGDLDRLVARHSPDVAESITGLRASLARVSEAVDTVSYHLEGGSRNMHEFSRRIRDNPSALLLSSAPDEGGRR